MDIETGKVLSENQSKLLKAFTDSQDRADISILSGIGTSTLRDITYRGNAVTDRSLPAVIMLFERATENAENSYQDAMIAKRDIKAILDTI